MTVQNRIRALFDANSIVMYQAYSDAIADAALAAGRFVPPFSMGRMTWIKPSFLWLMHRSNWAHKPNQTRVLRVRITREGWDHALSKGVLTSYEPRAHASDSAWRREFEGAAVHVQWDPERTLRGADAQINAIQVGLSRSVIEQFVHEWTVSIEDITPLARKMHALLQSGQAEKARRLLPPEKEYAVEAQTARRLAVG